MRKERKKKKRRDRKDIDSSYIYINCEEKKHDS